jgi:type IV pilus assembly protein PilC
MPQTFQYKVRDRAGNLISGTLVADSEMLVLQRLREQGYTPLEVGKEKKGLNVNIQLSAKKVKLKEVAVFSRQFATMINSGLPILRALSILAEQSSNSSLASALTAARADVEQGSSLSQALAKHPKIFNDLYIAMVKSGETGGSLDDTLLRLAAMLEREVQLRGKIKSAMTYPVAVVGLVTLIMSAMLLFVVPQFKTIYGQLGGTLPLPTRVLIGISDLFKKWWYVFVAAVFLIRFLLRRYKRTDRGREVLDSLKLRIPVFGSLFHKTALSRFSSTLAMLLKSGVPILQALDIVIDTVNNRVVGKAVEDVQSSVREGESIAKPLARHAVFPSMVVQMIAVGEETGQVDVMLEKVAQFYDQEVEASVDALTSLIEPLLIAFIGAAVGAAVIALYMPMFQVINLIK